MNLKDQKSQPHNDGSVNPANSEVQAGVCDPPLDAASAIGNPPTTEGAAPSSSVATVCQPAGGVRAVEGECEPFPPVTGTALEAEDRALLRAENARLRRLADAMFRERKRRYNWLWCNDDMGYPWVHRLFSASGYPFSDEETVKVYWQVEDEFAALKRKQLARKQSPDKEG
jgi:hypothetical protein